MPVMSTQVLMRATALADALPGNKPTLWNSGVQIERNTCHKREYWSKRHCQKKTCRVHTKYTHSSLTKGGFCNLTVICNIRIIIHLRLIKPVGFLLTHKTMEYEPRISLWWSCRTCRDGASQVSGGGFCYSFCRCSQLNLSSAVSTPPSSRPTGPLSQSNFLPHGVIPQSLLDQK